MSSYDIVTMGRVGVDLYPEQIGVSLADVRTFAKSLGGSPTNVAVGAARLGHRAAVITKVGADGFGPYVRKALQDFGVEDRFVGTHDTLRTPIVFCEIHPPDSFPLLFYREPTAPDMTITRDELPFDAIRDAALFWTTGTGLSAEPSRTATIAALDAARGIRVHDLDYRPTLWPDAAEARRWTAEAVRRATVVVGNVDEIHMATAARDRAAANALLALGPKLVIIKRGDAGVTAFTRDDEIHRPAVRVKVLCGLGAGDAFGAALAHGLLAQWELAEILEFANAAGAIVASRLACADAMPTAKEITELRARAVA